MRLISSARGKDACRFPYSAAKKSERQESR